MSVGGTIFNGEEMLIDKIPQGQLCQVFDPIMINPDKLVNILDDPMKANTSCFAPAYIYMEGGRGKRFLCDYHYALEKSITCQRTPHLWNDIAKYVVDEREKIKETFAELDEEIVLIEKICWCGAESLVKITNKESNISIYFCNFHYRKTYFRYFSNNRIVEDIFYIIDERKRMTKTIKEESETLISV